MLTEHKEQGISTYVDYSIKKLPSDLVIKEGSTYEITTGYDIRKAIIQAIRQLGSEVLVFYKVDNSTKSWESKWEHKSCNLNTFKMQMLDFGRVSEITVFHPGKTKID